MKYFLYSLINMVLLGGTLFGSAGRWDIPFFWMIIGMYLFLGILGYVLLDPGLLQERVSPKVKTKELKVVGIILIPLFIIHLVIAGLDVGRYHWSDNISLLIQFFGLLITFLSWTMMIWTMRVNRFFSPAVRIQEERGHHLITNGPYQYIRHPGYAFAILGFLTQGIALGSWVSVLPMIIAILLLFRRIIYEDKFLHENLTGYKEYAQKVPYRLIPGIW